MTGGVGGLIGTFKKERQGLEKEKPLNASGYSYGFSLDWHPEFRSGPSLFSLGISGRLSKLNYAEDHINKQATFFGAGPKLGLFLPVTELFYVHFQAAYYPSSSLTTLSTNSVKLNDGSFHYATGETFSGPGASEIRINFTHDKSDGQFSKRNRFRSGIGVSLLQEQFRTVTTHISTSKDELTPTETQNAEHVQDVLSLMTVDFFLGLTF